MNSFKDIAYQILKEAGKPLHSKEITKIALSRGWLKTAGKTPEATMNAQLVVDINAKKEKSRFIKTAPSTFGLNPEYKVVAETKIEEKIEKIYKVSKDVSTKQKGDIAEARIAELITLYGDTTLSCYKPISDDEGIDLIVKEKGSLKTMYIQIKSRFGDNPDEIFTATTKASAIADNYSMAVVFCFFDTEEGDLWDYLWFVSAPDLIKLANKLDGGRLLGFVAGRKKKESSKWDNYLIDKRDLANQIIAQMKRI
ncbi:MAG TPA: HTH domain-containing protein [Candidatus Pacearchaeota archaeon]|nr:HTH domain-containing protein [Candidatus Pacearchaeota archaeon]